MIFRRMIPIATVVGAAAGPTAWAADAALIEPSFDVSVEYGDRVYSYNDRPDANLELGAAPTPWRCMRLPIERPSSGESTATVSCSSDGGRTRLVIYVACPKLIRGLPAESHRNTVALAGASTATISVSCTTRQFDGF